MAMTAEKRPKKILIFSLVYLPRFVGGAEVAVKEITDRINPRLFSFEMISLSPDRDLPRRDRMGRILVHRLPAQGGLLWPMAKLLFPFRACVAAARLHRQEPFDAVWSIMANYAGFAALFFKLMHQKVPLLLSLQEGDPLPLTERKARFVWPLFRMIFTKADRIQAISSYLARWAGRMGARGEVVVVPNGVDVKKFRIQDSKSEIGEVRKVLGFGKSDRVVITVSRLVPKNGVGDLIKAMTFLPAEVKLVIVGDGPLLQNLQLTAYSLKLTDRVKFSGLVPPDKVPEYLAAADVFCRPSLSEGFGNAFIEAMAAGLPVVGTAVGGITDFLRDKETGLICVPSDPEDIARKIEILLKDREIRDYVVRNALKMVEQMYDWSFIAERMEEKVFPDIPNHPEGR